jgi:hypothetical protein
MLKTKVFLLTLALIMMFPGISCVYSDYELDSCIEDCRSTFDPDKDQISYSGCVEECKRRSEDRAASESIKPVQ